MLCDQSEAVLGSPMAASVFTQWTTSNVYPPTCCHRPHYRHCTMADQPAAAAISSAFPAPPPFYKSFTAQNLEAQAKYLETTNEPTSGPLPTPASGLDLLTLPPELRNLFPPAPPPDGKYRSFGIEHDVGAAIAMSTTGAVPLTYRIPQISPAAFTEAETSPTPARLQDLTHNLLLSFLSLINILATNPGAWPPIWDELHASFREVHEVINGYRPHQARETLILMMEEQVEKVRAETKAVRESVARAREFIEGLGKEEVEGVMDVGRNYGTQKEEGKQRRRQDSNKKLWEVLEREVGRI